MLRSLPHHRFAFAPCFYYVLRKFKSVMLRWIPATQCSYNAKCIFGKVSSESIKIYQELGRKLLHVMHRESPKQGNIGSIVGVDIDMRVL
jgi:hypothetical protein